MGSQTQAEAEDAESNSAEEEDQDAVNEEVENEERPIAPVHFFMPDYYIDAWTLERLTVAVKACREGMRKEIQELMSHMKQIGGGSWQQMMDYILGKGFTLDK